MRRRHLMPWVLGLAAGCGPEEAAREGKEHSPPAEVLACASGRADCNQDATDGCEVDLSRDSSHCGECLRSCGYALCGAGQCGPEPDIVATWQDGVCGMASDESRVFWGNCGGGQIQAISTSAGVPKTLATQQDWQVGFAVDEMHVWWSTMGNWKTQGRIRRVEKGGGTVSDVVIDDDVWGIALDADRVYWTRRRETSGGTQGAVMSMPKAGGEAVSIADTPGAEIAVSDTAVFWVDPQEQVLFRAEKTGGDPMLLATTEDIVSALVLYGDYVYWADYAGLFRVPASGGAVDRIDDGGAGLRFDDTGRAYYESNGQVVELADGNRRALASVEGSVGGLALVGAFVYFGDFNQNVIVRVAR